MTSPKLDRRIARSKNDIKHAFMSLLEVEQDIKKISIIELIEKANYNRTTFYAHYSDKYELVEEIMEDAIKNFIQAYRAPYDKNKVLNMTTISSNNIKIFEYVESEASLFKILFTHPTFSSFPKKFVTAVEHICANEIIQLHPDFNEIDKKLYVRSSAYSIIGLIQLWIDEDFKYSSQYITDQFLKILNFRGSEFKTIMEDN